MGAAARQRRGQVRPPTTLVSPEMNTTRIVRRSPRHHTSDPTRCSLFLVATAFVARGLEPNEAYTTAFYYVYGPGRGRTWISAVAEQDAIHQPHLATMEPCDGGGQQL